jgi:23S rRNA (pseudouridine1915-N3)-methyltransferase
MRLTLAQIASRSAAGDDFERLTIRYLQRIEAYYPCEAASYRSEAALLESLDKRSARTPTLVVLLDSRGRQMTSEAFAAWLAERRDQGAQHILFAVGPPSGWSEKVRVRAQLLFSLGPLTLAHALARLVLAEQLYRACTILAGHPYHTGH